ncbi:MAG: hypothetical protein NVSMB5_24360 [Candidatus Velthaea sp.]
MLRAKKQYAAILALVLVTIAHAAIAQPIPAPSASPSPGLSEYAAPPGGLIPANIALNVTGVPAADGTFLEAQIRDALDRQIRPSLRPGVGIKYGPIAPWPLLPLALGMRAAVNVTVSISGDSASTATSGVTTVTLENVAVPPVAPGVLFLSDDPEYLQSEGLVFRGTVFAARAARLYYYHSDIGAPRDVDVVVTAAVPTRLQFVQSGAGPDLDVMSVGHIVSRDFLRFQQQNQGTVIDVLPGTPFIVRHGLILQGELVAGAVDFNVIRGGPIDVSVVASPAGSRPDAYLNGPRVPYDGHGRHGTFALDDYGPIAASYSIGGPDTAIKYGGRTPTPRNIDPSDPGRDYGDYGIIHRITFTLVNPTDEPHVVYLYQKPLGGPVRSSFYVDGQLRELGCTRLPQPYWLTSYQLPAHSTGASTTVTMTDGGSYYPLEFGVTQTPPLPYTPRLGTADGCSPNFTRLSVPAALGKRD